MKRATKHTVFRFCLLLVIVVFGAMALAQAQRGFKKQAQTEPVVTQLGQTDQNESNATDETAVDNAGFQPIPVQSQAGADDLAPANAVTEGEWTHPTEAPLEATVSDNGYGTESFADARQSTDDGARIVTVSAQNEAGLPPLLDPPPALDQGSYTEEALETESPPPLQANLSEPSSVYDPGPPANTETYPQLAPEGPPDLAPEQTSEQGGYGPPEQLYGRPDAGTSQYVEESQTPPLYRDDSFGDGTSEVTPTEVPPLEANQSDNENILRNDLRSGASGFPASVSQPPQDPIATPSTGREFDGISQEFDTTPATAPGAEGYAGTASNENGLGKPGPPELEGLQSATLTLEKSAPRELRVGSPGKFKIVVNNQGNIPAHEVIIRDEVPYGTRLINTIPQAERMSDGSLVWQMGTIKPGGQVTVEIEVMPVMEGQVGSVATVAFQSSAAARSIVTQPRLSLQQTAPRQVLVGDDVIFKIQLSNPGTGTATNVKLEEDVPEGLMHHAGRELEYKVGTLNPNETKYLELTLKADKAGLVENTLVVTADSNLSVTETAQVEIVAPQLTANLEGPNRRYLRREATLDVAISNPGTAPAKNVEIVAHLPTGLKFVNTTNNGYYDSSSHSVHWSLAELPAKQTGSPKLVVLPVEMGPQKIRLDCRAQMNLNDTVEKTLEVEGLAALLFQLADISDPIEIGGQTTYEIRVVNQGSKSDTNIQIVAAIPQGMRAVDASGPTRAIREPGRVVFEPLPRLAPKTDAIFKIHVQGESAGDKRFRVQLTSDNIQQPVIKEESTKVYSDE